MKNPISDCNLFLIDYRQEGELAGDKTLVSISYVGKSGMVRAFKGFSDIRLAYAGGGGYDKIGTCLATCIETLTGVKIINGASGVSAVIHDAESKGVRVVDILANAINN